MSQIAIFSDVHGNLPALQTVLKDIESRKVDQVYCLGDLVDFAPWGNEVIATIKDLRIPCLMGNHDERIAFDYEVIPLSKHSAEETTARMAAIQHTRQAIQNAHKMYLAHLPHQIRLTFHIKGRKTNILLVHGSTRSNEEYIYENHPLEDIHYMMEQHQADVLIMGHTHLSYIRPIPVSADVPDKLVANCGAVGRSKEGQSLATYLLLHINEEGIQTELIKLEYPVEEVVAGILQSAIPDFYARFLMGANTESI